MLAYILSFFLFLYFKYKIYNRYRNKKIVLRSKYISERYKSCSVGCHIKLCYKRLFLKRHFPEKAIRFQICTCVCFWHSGACNKAPKIRILNWVLSLWHIILSEKNPTDHSMVNVGLQQWLRALVLLVVLFRTASSLVDITYVLSAVAKGAVCLDGSPPAYHLDRGYGTGINNWLIQLEGGGWCNNVTTCLSRMNTRLGSSKQMAKQLAFSGLLGNKAQFNPDFYNWNRVKVRYCDGSSFTGDVAAVNPKTNLHFRGARIFLAVMEDLLVKGMKNAENAILSGCSAGGLASILHCDSFKALLPMGAKVKCLSDAGYFINAMDITHAPHIEQYFSDIVRTHGSAKNLPLSCTLRLKPNLCFFPQNVAQHVQTPLFIINAAYDSWQIKNILAPGVADPHGTWRNCKLDILKCTPIQLQIMHGYRLQFLKALFGVGPSSSRGFFINSCYAHCQTEVQETWFRNDSPRLVNKTIAKAVGDWFYDRAPFQKIDCPYPCDKTCHNRVFDTAEDPLI